MAYRDDFSEVGVVAGRVVRFDGARGYGFIAPDNGEEDVFLHANDLLIPEAYLRSGLAVEFDVDVGDRGPKASSVRLAEGAESPVPVARNSAGDNVIDDVVGEDEFTVELTELLLRTPSLTAAQIVEIRRELTAFVKKHGWVEG
ncbi:hypothetical protein SVTN_32285 [Streptomyces vietnamensis]|uniref:CSD domain-containing protein n=1 Tax=Streptomyces vietnamensis TaxID=362257 RepID=A0A0B5I2G4_9ACTN|nr:cold shock domain-containing protein [Streptomyces vietnamensis]AJF68335.1 hypothetical protein SVTN_32285 [Streptomyces vietnamensis]